MKHLTLGILAHVDSGKTTLTEAMLYKAGNIRHLGRVDSRDTFLDVDVQERERGITIVSKQAELSLDDMQLTLLDTPGHVDFGAEAESVLKVLDYCILLISAPDGVKAHTLTLWRLLKAYDIPTLIFINKMDQPGSERELILKEINKKLSGDCIDFSRAAEGFSTEDKEAIAACDEEVMESYLEDEGSLSDDTIADLIAERKLFPVIWGSALKLDGIDSLFGILKHFTKEKSYPDEFAARVFKISRDAKGQRLTHVKILGGSLRSKDMIGDEKVEQLRVYSGEKYESVTELPAGRICALTGLNNTESGMGLGTLTGSIQPALEPVLAYKVSAADGTDPAVLYEKLRILEEEDPQLYVNYDEELKQLTLRLMGEVQLQVLTRRLSDRFGISINTGEGSVVYKETICDTVEGVGHFEPLRHYAEVHLLLEPAPRGSGLSFDSICSEDILDKNWQRLIYTHLRERVHRGVLTGAPITDMKISILTGRAHQKHTEGGDFRQATYRALRQGLMQARSLLLEPYFEYRIELPAESLGRAMSDIEQMHGSQQPPEMEDGIAVLCGTAPVICIRNYARELAAYTQGRGSISLSPAGYGDCHNTEEVMNEKNYLPEEDLRNTPDSVFCAHGSGFVVPWDKVFDYMHVESAYHPYPEENARSGEHSFHPHSERSSADDAPAIGTDEIDEILNRTFYSNSLSNVQAEAEKRKGVAEEERRRAMGRAEDFDEAYADYEYRPKAKKKEFLIVDGYNMIFADSELKELAAENLDAARDRLIDMLANYQGYEGCELMVVFDAYRVKGRKGSTYHAGAVQVVFTAENETADQFIERFTARHGREYDMTVATSDRLEQDIAWGNNCRRLSARELHSRLH